MRAPYIPAHLRAPCGLWFIVCQGRTRTLRDGASVVFSHLWERKL